MGSIISKYGKDANLELEIEIYGWRCSNGILNLNRLFKKKITNIG